MAKKENTLIWIGAGVVAFYLIFSSNSASASAGSVSSDQLALTASYETFSATAYPDGTNPTTGAQLYSIGYGHQIQPNESYLLTQTISQSQAQQLLLQDLAAVIAAINNSGVSFTQGQQDALTDFGYNEGIGAMNKIINTFSTQGDQEAQAELLQYVYWHPVPGGPAVLNQTLVNRRNDEINTWNS